ncbi:MAG: MATE family efflux transporter [Flavobacterium sp. BFFFF2]|nr:MAG: MATE family efflux transporter [Flavobacterium sp. BFFFF2]
MLGSVYRREFAENIRLAYPVILGMIGHTLIGIVDNIMVGKLGSTELAAVSLGNSLIFVAMSFGIGFSTALTPLIAEQNQKTYNPIIHQFFKQGVQLCLLIGILLFGLVELCKPLMYLMHQPKEVIALAAPFLDGVALSLIPLIAYQGYKQFADGLSMTRYSMYAILMANVVHVGLNYWFIYGGWFVPAMGIQGAALGTVISRLLMVLFMHLILSKNAITRVYFPTLFKFSFNKKMCLQICKLGIPSALQMFFEVVLFTAAIWLCGSLGKSSQAANQVALSLASFTFMFAMGLSVVAMIRVGNAHGSQDYNKLLVVARSIFIMAVGLEILFALIFLSLHDILPYLFLDVSSAKAQAENSEVLLISSELLVVAAFFQLSDGIQVVVLGALRGLQDAKWPMYITFISYWLIGFPISLYLGFYTPLKATGIWMGLLAGLTAAAALLYWRFHTVSKRLLVKNI